jgi:hypothetical protein
VKFVRPVIHALLLMLVCDTFLWSQTLKSRPAEPEPTPSHSVSLPAPIGSIPLTVPLGTPLKVALDTEVRVREVGQAIHGKTTEAVYAFDKLLIPAGTVVKGKVSAVDRVPTPTRLLDATDGNFSPARHVHVQFDELVMADGRHVSLHTMASPVPGGILRFVSANEKSERTNNNVGDAASKKVSAIREEVRRQWSDLQKQIHEPGKMHKLKRIAVAQLPVHPQYIDAGTSFNADLLEPLEFGTERVTAENLTEIGVHADGKRSACTAGDGPEFGNVQEGRFG